MDKDAGCGILLSHEKECNKAICSEIDGPRECHTEGSELDREGPLFLKLNLSFCRFVAP